MKPAADKNVFLLRVSLASLFVFIVTALIVFVARNSVVDDIAFNGLEEHNSSSATRVMLFITFLGKHSFFVPANLALALLFLLYKQWGWALRVLVVAVGGVSLMGLLKNVFARHRPPAPLVEGITNYGFPSGHAMMSVAFYGLLLVFCINYIKTKWLKLTSAVFLLLLIVLIGFSRIYLRVHYTTDVIAGYSFGLFWLCLCLFFANRIEQRTGRAA